MFTLVVNVASTVAADAYGRANDAIDYTGRVAGKVEHILDQITETLDAGAPLIAALTRAIEDGLIDELRAALSQVEGAVDLVGAISQQIDQAMPIFDATGPALGLVNTTIEQVNALPGAKFVRRRITRSGGTTVETAEIVDS